MEIMGLPQATFIFIAANILISVAGFANEKFTEFGLLDVQAIRNRQEWHRILISGFLHADPFHLLVNMLTLYFFGPAIERQLGPQAFFLIYLGALIFGNIGALIMHWRDRQYRALGASGAVSGVLFSFCLFAPFTLVYVFFAIPVPALLYAVLFVLYSLYGMRAQNDNIGHDAHLFGALSGLVITIILFPFALSYFFSQITGVFG